ncbi:MAG TPA: dihydroorotate dehydrogenase [Candidatus Limnocylindrales bacterium]|nr:dihydroorotate dehydrogenase [Candidatus Limnocylindrales bacterium]
MTPSRAPTLSVRIGSLTLRNPVLVASGIIGYGTEYEGLVDLKAIGGIVTKTVTRRARGGNPPPRVVEVPAGMLNSIGIENPGLEGFLETKVQILRKLPCAVIVSVEGEDTREFCELVDGVSRSGAAHAIEVNISCPNVGPHGLKYSTDAGLAREVMTAIRPLTKLPLIAKLTPNVTRIGEIAQACEACGADAVSLVNTFVGMAVDSRTHRPILGTVLGGLSGPAIKPLALAKTWETAQAVDIPVIGMGGIAKPADAVEFLLTGATAVQVGTALFADPSLAEECVRGIEEHLRQMGASAVDELIGALVVPEGRGMIRAGRQARPAESRGGA